MRYVHANGIQALLMHHGHGRYVQRKTRCRLKRANADLVAANQSLVAAGPEGAGALVNRAMQAELESLRAARGAEAAELADLISALEPVLDEAEARSKTETKDA